MWEKIKNWIITFFGLSLATLLFIAGRKSKPSRTGQSRADKNHSDIRQQLESDRERNAKAREDLERERELIDQERELIDQGRESNKRVGSIIDNARADVHRILGDKTKGN